MIRKTIIVTLTLGALCVGTLWVYGHARGNRTALLRFYRDAFTILGRPQSGSVNPTASWCISNYAGTVEFASVHLRNSSETEITLPSEWPLGPLRMRRWMSPVADWQGTMVHWQIELALWFPFVALAAYPSVVFVRATRRWWQRRDPGLCRICRYNLFGNVSGVCPECGTKIELP